VNAAQLANLLRARRYGPSRWMAKCPGHDDRKPSLSIREGRDGRVILYDFGGCPPQKILETVGLSFCDLFPATFSFTPAQRARQACERTAREEAEAQARELERTLADDCRISHVIADALLQQLRVAEEAQASVEAAALTALWHKALAKARWADQLWEWWIDAQNRARRNAVKTRSRQIRAA
jgi:hypothetical protein